MPHSLPRKDGLTDELIEAMHAFAEDPESTSLLSLLVMASDGLTNKEARQLYTHLAARLGGEPDAREDLLITQKKILKAARGMREGVPYQLRWSLSCDEAGRLLASAGIPTTFPAADEETPLSQAQLRQFLELLRGSSIRVPGLGPDTQVRKLLEALVELEG